MPADDAPPTVVPREQIRSAVSSLRVVGPDGSEADLTDQMVLVETGLYRLCVERPESVDAAVVALAALEDYETQGTVRLHAITVSVRDAAPPPPDPAGSPPFRPLGPPPPQDLRSEACALFSWDPVEPQRAL